jgi:hypothetical protein
MMASAAIPLPARASFDSRSNRQPVGSRRSSDFAAAWMMLPEYAMLPTLDNSMIQATLPNFKIPQAGAVRPQMGESLLQGRGFSENPLPQIGTQAVLRQHVNSSTQELLEILFQTDDVQERPAGIDIHQQIKVALWPSITECDRPEDADILHAVADGEIEDLAATVYERCR